MSLPQALTATEISAALSKFPAWKLVDGKIVRDIEFKDFKEALAFMNAVGDRAEAMQHHPEWTNVYNRLHIELITHDAAPPRGALSALDFSLAEQIEMILSAGSK